MNIPSCCIGGAIERAVMTYSQLMIFRLVDINVIRPLLCSCALVILRLRSLCMSCRAMVQPELIRNPYEFKQAKVMRVDFIRLLMK